MKKIHLGCGDNIMPGWINVDMLDDPNILKFDLRNKMPFEDNSIDFFFCEHFFEHLSREEGLKLLKDIYRCLKPGGVSRIVVPDLEMLLKNYINNNITAYHKLNLYFRNRCEMVNVGTFVNTWGHKYMYDTEELLQIHKEAGFSPTMWPIKVSNYPELNGVGVRPVMEEISCEGKKV